ncbi:MAG TPA: helix-turn-helix domain-containing protein [Candidatus Cybelea sp.]|jgi:non-specific serine/threonine protein kinase
MEPASRPHFGALLRQFRLDAGITQQELAERAKLSVEAISTLERGTRTRPYRETVTLLARALKLSPEREALLGSAVGLAHGAHRRERSEEFDASPLRIVRSNADGLPPHNLPRQSTSLVGRQRELAEVTTLLRESRLLTIVGSGGVGKTRLAVQLGVELLEACPDGVWLADLAPLTDPTLVASTILHALQVPSTTGSDVDVLLAYLKTRHALLILDNCEHVIRQARDVAAHILQSCAHVRVVSTSRQALAVSGESVYRLPSLATPATSCRTAREARVYGAVTLFAARAVAANPDFALSDSNAAEVGEICRRLDGIPLAIELAAARVNVLAPHQIAQRLDQRFRLLAAGDSRALPRHQTMTALFDWSYDLLTAREQRFFEALSVFAGGFTLEAATAVGATDAEDDIDVVELVASLITKSLLVAESADLEQRYRLLESSRQYARSRLIARGEQEQIARRHALFYVELAEHLEMAWHTMPERAWLSHANVLLENLRAALDWTLEKRGDVILGLRLAALRMMMRRSFPLAEARRRVRTALELVDEHTPPQLLARLEHADGAITGQLGEITETLAAAERTLVRYRRLGDVVGVAYAQVMLGGPLVILERFEEAEPMLREALDVARRLGDRRLAAAALRMIGQVQSLTGDFDRARATLTEARGLAQAAGADFLAASLGGSLSSNEYDAGNVEAALALTMETIAIYRGLGPSALYDLPGSLAGMAMHLIALRRFDEARASANEALELAHGLGIVVMTALSLGQLAVVAQLRPRAKGRSTSDNCAAAAQILGFVDARLTTLGIPKKYGLAEYDDALKVLGDDIGAEALAKLLTAGASMTEDEAIARTRGLEPDIH